MNYKENQFLASDEWFTPSYAVSPILKYIPKDAVVWCPFDENFSNYVHGIETHIKRFQHLNIKLIYTHIRDGTDFFTCEIPKGITHIISNPPYSKKLEVLKRLKQINLPFAILMPMLTLESKKRAEILKTFNLQLMLFSPRIQYKNIHGDKSSVYNTCYICHNFINNAVIFRDVSASKTVKNEW